MADLVEIIAKNQTASPVEITDLGVTVPGSGEFILSEGFHFFEIQISTDLQVAIDDGYILIGDSNTTLNQEASTLAVTPTGRVTITDNQSRIDLIEDAIDGYVDNESLVLSNLGDGTLADLNSAITDATLKNVNTASFYQSVNATTFTSSSVVVSFDQVFANTDGTLYSLSGGEVTVARPGTLFISTEVSLRLESSNRTTSRVFIERDTGSGFSEIVGTSSYGYHRNTTSDEDTNVISIAVPVSAGDVFRVMASRQSGTQTLGFLDNASRLTLTHWE